jgi:hypothetical protein
MKLIKVIPSNNSKSSKLLEVDDLQDLKEKAESMFGIEIETFKRNHDGCEIDDNDKFLEFCNSNEEFSVIVVQNNSKSAKLKNWKQKIINHFPFRSKINDFFHKFTQVEPNFNILILFHELDLNRGINKNIIHYIINKAQVTTDIRFAI